LGRDSNDADEDDDEELEVGAGSERDANDADGSAIPGSCRWLSVIGLGFFVVSELEGSSSMMRGFIRALFVVGFGKAGSEIVRTVEVDERCRL
jgi:hypothetical protein